MRPLVSVIIPVYNGRKYIAEAIGSVLAQTYDHLELLVIDDGSTDGLNHLMDELVKTDPRIKYFCQDNRGVSAARNNGFNRSAGELVAFLDADDIWLPENLELKIRKFSGAPAGMVLVHSDAAVIDDRSADTGEFLKGEEGSLLDGLLEWKRTQIPGPSSILVKRAALTKVGMFDEGLTTGADKDFFIRIAAGHTVGRVEQVTWKYRVHPHNMHRNIAAMERDMVRVYEKARSANLFRNRSFERRCFAAMYMILANSWAGDGRDFSRSAKYYIRALQADPAVFFNRIRKTLTK